MAIARSFFRPPPGHFFLFGPRGTGKSTWLQAAFPEAVRVDLLAPAQQRRYAARPERLRELAAAGPADIVIDEVQRAPELLTVVHQLVLYGRGVFWALEVKHAARIRPADLRPLKIFAQDYPRAQTRLAYLGGERLQIDGVLCLPAAELLHGIVPGTPLP